MSQLAVILPAAGQSTRFGGRDNKLHTDLAGATVLHRSIRAFVDRTDVDSIIVVGADPDFTSEKISRRGGGSSRAQSVLNGLRAIPSHMEWVAIHDAARPLVSQHLIDETFAAAKRFGAAVPALPVHLTIKLATGPLPAKVERTIPRESLWTMQTPQIMRRADLLEAYDKCPVPLDQITDDVQLLELIGKPVYLIVGEERNLKITTPIDLEIAKIILAS